MNADHDPLIPIQLGRIGEAPVFCVPGAGANVAYFRSLAERIGSDATVYGLQPRGLDGETPPHASVEEAAASYLQAIERLSPTQPLRLIGHSFGAWVAFEMAGRWSASGRQMAPLILLDSEAPDTQDASQRRHDPITAMLRLVEILGQACEKSLGIDAAALQARTPAECLDLLRERMVGLKLISSRTPASSIEAMFRVFSVNLRTRYIPHAPYLQPVCMIRAGDDGASARDMAGWRRHAPAMVICDGPGNHMTMLAARHADRLALLILENWRAA